MRKFIGVFILLVLFSSVAFADFDFSKIKDNVSEFTLPNGLKFILLEDHSVPIATFMTYVNVGGSDERIGIWGISHFVHALSNLGYSWGSPTIPKARISSVVAVAGLVWIFSKRRVCVALPSMTEAAKRSWG